MRTVILDPPTAGLEQLVQRRRRSGLDRLDEVWHGELHMVPAPGEAHARIATQLARLLGPLADDAGLITAMHEFNLGKNEDDFRVPDGGLHRTGWGTWAHTAALLVEIVSPHDETWDKLEFYAGHEVDELLIVDPQTRSVDWLGLTDGRYEPLARSRVIELGGGELAALLRWPEIPGD